MSNNANDDLKMAINDAKPAFFIPGVDHHVRIVSKEEVFMRQILKNQLLIMDSVRRNCDIRSQNAFQEAINETQKLLNGDLK